MEDSDVIDSNGFKVQEYTIHIGKPIYANKEENSKQQINYLMQENYSLWKDIYEKTYNIPLEYAAR
jgi:hypothetical protein